MFVCNPVVGRVVKGRGVRLGSLAMVIGMKVNGGVDRRMYGDGVM